MNFWKACPLSGKIDIMLYANSALLMSKNEKGKGCFNSVIITIQYQLCLLADECKQMRGKMFAKLACWEEKKEGE